MLPCRRVVENVTEKILAVGKMNRISLDSLEHQVSSKLSMEVTESTGEMYQYKRLLVDGQMIHSEIYQRVSQRNSYTVQYFDNNEESFAHVISYLKIVPVCTCVVKKDCKCLKPKHYVLTYHLPSYPLEIVTDKFPLTGLKLRHMFPVKKLSSGDIRIFPVTSIQSKVLYADGLDEKEEYAFVCKFPNNVERD